MKRHISIASGLAACLLLGLAPAGTGQGVALADEREGSAAGAPETAVSTGSGAEPTEDRTGGDEATVAATPKPRTTLFVEGTLIGTVNRIGALLELALIAKHRLYDSRSFVLEDNFVGAGLLVQVSPVFAHPGAYVEIAPASFFRLRASYQLVTYFGVLNAMLPLSDCDGPLAHDDSARCEFEVDSFGPRLPGVTSDWGHRLRVHGQLRAKLGPIVAMNTFAVEHWWFREGWAPGAGFDAWYNDLHYLPQERADTVLTNTGTLLFEILKDRGGSKPHLMVGADSRLAYSTGLKYMTHRVGPMAILHIPEWKKVHDIAVVLMVHWYTHDRYKAGALPFFGLVLSAATPNLL